jgi:phosphohistidine phosphatase
MGQLLFDQDLVPDLIVSSTARRAKDTAEMTADACGYENEIIFTRDLYHAGIDSFLWVLGSIPDDVHSAMVVGHNPGVEELLEYLTDASEWLPTAALAQIELSVDKWSALVDDVEGKLINLWRPREL